MLFKLHKPDLAILYCLAQDPLSIVQLRMGLTFQHNKLSEYADKNFNAEQKTDFEQWLSEVFLPLRSLKTQSVIDSSSDKEGEESCGR